MNATDFLDETDQETAEGFLRNPETAESFLGDAPVASPTARASFGPPGENPEGVVRSDPSNLLEMEAARIAPEKFTPERIAFANRDIDTPLVSIPRLNEEEASSLIGEGQPAYRAQVVQGLHAGIADLVEGMTTPTMLSTLPWLAAPGPVGAAIKGVISLEMAKGAASALPEIYKAAERGDKAEVTRLSIGYSANALMSLGLGKHAIEQARFGMPVTAKGQAAWTAGKFLERSLENKDVAPSLELRAELPAIIQKAQEAGLPASAETLKAIASDKPMVELASVKELPVEETAANFLAKEPAAVTPVAATEVKAEGKLHQAPGAALGGEGSEIRQPSENTGIKKDSINAQRELRGEEPLERGEPKSDKDLLEQAKAKMESDSTWTDSLEAEIDQNPRGLSDLENAGMALRLTELRKEYEAASNELSRAKEAGESTDAANRRVQELSDRMDRTERAVSIGGSATELGRGLRSLQLMVAPDFSLAAMERRIRNSRDGAPLSEAEHIQLRKDFNEIKSKLEVEEQKVKAAEDKYLDAELNRVKAEAKAGQAKQFHPSIIEHAERFVKRMEETSEKYAKEIFGQFNSPTPDVLAKAAFIGATKLARIGLDVTRWTAEMIKELGPGFEKFKDQVLEMSKQVLEDQISASEKQPGAPKIAKAVNRPTNIAEKIDAEKIKIASKVEKGEPNDIGPNVEKLVRSIVEKEPNVTRDGLTDQVHAILKEFLPEITREETMDAISGRGKFTLPKQDFVSKIVRDLKQQLRLVGHALDVAAGKPLPRTGPQRDPMSDVARGLQRQLTEPMRKYGVKVTDPAKQLASTLNSRKTFYRHRIADLTQEIATRERIVKSKSPSPTDAELESLRAELKELQIEEKKVFPREKISEEDQLKLAIEGAKKNEARWNERLARAQTGDFSSGKTPGRKVTSPELEAIKSRVEHAKAAVKELQDIANPKKTPEEIALRSFMTRKANERAKYLEKMAAGDFSTPKRAPFDISKYPEAMKAKAEADAVKNEWMEKRRLEQLRLRTLPRKIWDGIKQTAGIPANLVTSIDFSAPRQAFVALLSLSTRPVRGWPIIARSMGEYFTSAFSEKRALDIEATRKSRRNAINGVDKIAKVDYADLNETKFTPREDYARSVLDQWAKIPYKTGNMSKTIALAPFKAVVKGVRGSNRGFITFLNSVRAAELDLLLKINFKDRPPTDIEIRDIGNAVNMSTGRGNMNPMTAKVLGGGLWSPNLFVNRLKTLVGQPLLHPGSLRTKKIVAMEYVRVLSSAYVLSKIAGMFDEKGEEEKTSSDYGKIVRGDIRDDIYAGYQQWIVLFNRLWNDEITNIKGQTKDANLFEVGGRFLRSKANPLVGAGIDVVTREDFLGNKTTPQGVIVNLTVPLSLREIKSIMTGNGFTEGMVHEALQMFGGGVSVYDDQRKP